MDSPNLNDGLQPELRLAGFFVAVCVFVVAGILATPLPPLLLVYVLVFTTAFDNQNSLWTSPQSLGRKVINLGLRVARHMASSWLCLFVLFISFGESLYESEMLAWGFFGATASAWAASSGRLIRWARNRTERLWSRSMRGSLALSVVTLLVGLAARPPQPLNSERYRDLVGSRYEVVADDLHAYGVQSFPERRLENITIIPGVGIGGRYIAFERSIPRGSQIEIESAWHAFTLFDNGDYYLVQVSGGNLPLSVPIKIEMFRGNEGAGVNLNSMVYRRLATPNR